MYIFQKCYSWQVGVILLNILILAKYMSNSDSTLIQKQHVLHEKINCEKKWHFRDKTRQPWYRSLKSKNGRQIRIKFTWKSHFLALILFLKIPYWGGGG